MLKKKVLILKFVGWFVRSLEGNIEVNVEVLVFKLV